MERVVCPHAHSQWIAYLAAIVCDDCGELLVSDEAMEIAEQQEES